ncbi:hypothetical protein [Tissierella sp.]|uniref:hypothetical protein n=1 Tax=Tissierella sp. TaxID=41274 RepID=UPI0028B04B66|nr:hypothetical protein [Tissierella sp.]
MKNNRILLLLLILALALGISNGCVGNNKVQFEGVENKKLTKDLIELRDLIISSIKHKKYMEDDIDKILEKISDKKYQEKLNDIEIQLINNINNVKEHLKYDLTNGEKIITSSTYEKINWLLQATTEKP